MREESSIHAAAPKAVPKAPRQPLGQSASWAARRPWPYRACSRQRWQTYCGDDVAESCARPGAQTEGRGAGIVRLPCESTPGRRSRGQPMNRMERGIIDQITQRRRAAMVHRCSSRQCYRNLLPMCGAGGYLRTRHLWRGERSGQPMNGAELGIIIVKQHDTRKVVHTRARHQGWVT